MAEEPTKTLVAGPNGRSALTLHRLLLFAMLLLACASAFAQTTGRLVGRVTTDGEPRSDVTVNITSPSLVGTAPRPQVTDATGAYSFDSLPTGRYTVTFELTGFRTVTQNAEVRSPETSRIDAQLEALWYRNTKVVTPLIVLGGVALIAVIIFVAKRYKWWAVIKKRWEIIRETWRETIAEMKKVTWPARPEVVGTTVIVVVATLVFAVYLWGCDVVFFKAIDFLFKKFGAT